MGHGWLLLPRKPRAFSGPRRARASALGELIPATSSRGQRKATERGQLGSVLGWGLAGRAGVETPPIIAVRCLRNTRNSWEPGGGAVGGAGQRLRLVLRTLEHIPSPGNYLWPFSVFTHSVYPLQ